MAHGWEKEELGLWSHVMQGPVSFDKIIPINLVWVPFRPIEVVHSDMLLQDRTQIRSIMLPSAVNLFQDRRQHNIFLQTLSSCPSNHLAFHSWVLSGPLLLRLEELWIEYAEVVVHGPQTVNIALRMCFTEWDIEGNYTCSLWMWGSSGSRPSIGSWSLMQDTSSAGVN